MVDPYKSNITPITTNHFNKIWKKFVYIILLFYLYHMLEIKKEVPSS